jgi:hypothetical protein
VKTLYNQFIIHGLLLMKKEKSNSFENFSDWLKHDDQPHISSKGLSKVIKQKQVLIDSQNSLSANKSVGNDHNSSKKKPQVTIEESDGIVTGLKITCVCGELIHVHFDYDPETGETFLHNR